MAPRKPTTMLVAPRTAHAAVGLRIPTSPARLLDVLQKLSLRVPDTVDGHGTRLSGVLPPTVIGKPTLEKAEWKWKYNDKLYPSKNGGWIPLEFQQLACSAADKAHSPPGYRGKLRDGSKFMDAACKGEAPAFKSARTEETSPCLADQKSAVVPPLPLHSLEEAAEMTQKYPPTN